LFTEIVDEYSVIAMRLCPMDISLTDRQLLRVGDAYLSTSGDCLLHERALQDILLPSGRGKASIT
jgi:hypothetical protein